MGVKDLNAIFDVLFERAQSSDLESIEIPEEPNEKRRHLLMRLINALYQIIELKGIEKAIAETEE